MKLILIILCLFCFTISKGQPPKVNTDSLQRVMIDSVNKLLTEKFMANTSLVDSTLHRIKDKLSANEYEKWGGAYTYFIGELYNYWLELNARKGKSNIMIGK